MSRKNKSIWSDERGELITLAVLSAGAITILGFIWEALKVSAETLFKFVQVMLSHPLLSYVTILFLLFVDTATFGQSGFGLVGGIFSGVFQLLNFPIELTSFHLLVVLVIFPVLIFALNKSGKN